MAVEGGHQGQRLPSRFLKFGIRSDCDFLQGFQTIRDKGRAEDHDPALSRTGQSFQYCGSVGLKPAVAAQAGLERKRPAFRFDFQSLGKPLRTVVALGAVAVAVFLADLGAAVGLLQAPASRIIAFLHMPCGQTVKTEKHMIRH